MNNAKTSDETPPSIALHHVSLPVTDLDASRRFYREIVGLREIDRPPFSFPGAWFEAGPGRLHLIVPKEPKTPPTFRTNKPVDSRDIHCAFRVHSFSRTKARLIAAGYSEDAADPHFLMIVNERAVAGFPQIYILDPDRNVIEINAERLD